MDGRRRHVKLSVVQRLYPTLEEAWQRIADLTDELERAADALQKLHPICQVKGIGILEVGLAAEQCADQAEMIAKGEAAFEQGGQAWADWNAGALDFGD